MHWRVESADGKIGDKRWIKFWEWPLEEQRLFIDRLNCNFFANEGYIDDTFARMDGFYYLLCLRNGVDRCISHYRHVLRLGKGAGTVQSLLDAPKKHQGLFNYATYQLSGRKVLGFDAQAVEIAKRNLALFDHIIFSETYDANMDKLIVDFGWNRPAKLPKRNTSSEDDGVKVQLTADVRAGLADLNGSDQAVFEWALEQR